MNPEWVVLHVSLFLEAAVSRVDHGLFAKLLEALRDWPEDQRTSLLQVMEDRFTADVLAVFPQEKCQVEFLVLVKFVARHAPDRAFHILKRAVISTPGSAGSAAIAAANIVAHTSNEKILADALEQMLNVAPHGSQRNARHALLRGLRIIDEKLGSRRVINRFFAMYSSVPDADALEALVQAVRKLPSWTSADSEELLRDTARIKGKIRSYILKRLAD
jgi:hypothetical protein